MGENNLQAESRPNTGKGVARKLRAAGMIPGVIYGAKSDSRPISVDPRSLERVLHASGSGMNTLIDLAVDGSDSVVLVKELQRDPIRGAYLHADFYEVDLTKPIEVMVPIHFMGRARGVEFGGIVDHPVRELDILCLPHVIPDSIEVDISELEIGDSLHVRDLVVPEGVTVLSDPELSIANVETPAVEEEPVVADVVEGDEAAAPAEGDAPATEEGEAKDSEG